MNEDGIKRRAVKRNLATRMLANSISSATDGRDVEDEHGDNLEEKLLCSETLLVLGSGVGQKVYSKS